ncbi:hypothetical protein [Terriglobus sp. TAA 43]|uniref:hypothetical protein n=1 Tax=Terriglobus sp. TAA 43 TaxID=278961 RepID=UPI0018DE3035|nr:hypothetical protein [Terriglobus sp. TAA 43]
MELDQPRYQAGSTRLVARSNASTVVAMEVLVKPHQIAPVRIIVEIVFTAEHRTFARLISKHNA